jgi:DNA-binding beta-propeller fold protein YncE
MFDRRQLVGQAIKRVTMPKTLNCSNCAAPVDLTAATGATLGCPYCGSIMILPEELRPRRGGMSSSSVGLNLKQAAALAAIALSLRAGNKAEAIRLYGDAFDVDHSDAANAVERMLMGQPVTLSVHTQGFASGGPSFALHPKDARKLKVGLIWVIGSVVVVFVVGAVLTVAFGGFAALMAARQVVPSPATVSPTPPTPPKPPTPPATPAPPAFAGKVLEFGDEGIGASQFKDARSVALDGEGRIYVGEYTGGRVQVFDSQGKFITQWMVDPKRALLNMAADRKGTVYVVHPGQILRYEGPTGSLLGEVSKLNGSRSEFYTEVAVALDGSLLAMSNYSTLLRIGANGQIREAIDLRAKIGEDVRFDRVAVDGTGNIYALSDRGDNVFIFAPDGRFINRFGGSGDQPGQLRSGDSIAVDGQGRIFVSDSSRGIQVFDKNGRYVSAIGKELVMGLAIGDRNEIIASERNRHRIVKYELTK